MRVYMLLDRSGSMQSQWSESLSAVNGYVHDLAKDKATKTARVTLATFDGQDGLAFDVIRDGVKAPKWTDVTDKDATPRGMTPLNDAISRLVALAEGEKPEKAVIITMTDGYENASRETTREAAKAAFDRCRAKNWQVVFLGANFDATQQAQGYGTGFAQTLNASTAGLSNAFVGMGRNTRVYAVTGAAFGFSDAQRLAAVQPANGNNPKRARAAA